MVEVGHSTTFILKDFGKQLNTSIFTCILLKTDFLYFKE